MTMTPRTDAEASIWNTGETVSADFARKLETELEELKRSIGHAVRIPYADRLRLLDIIE